MAAAKKDESYDMVVSSGEGWFDFLPYFEK
jgi:hypothetical protein